MKFKRFRSIAVTIGALTLACCAPPGPGEVHHVSETANLPAVDNYGNIVPSSIKPIEKPVVKPVEKKAAITKPRASVPKVTKPKTDPRDLAINEGNKAFSEVKELVEQLKMESGIQIYATNAKQQAASFSWNRFSDADLVRQHDQLAKVVGDIRRIEQLSNRKGIQYTKPQLNAGLKFVRENSSAYVASLEKYLKSKKFVVNEN